MGANEAVINDEDTLPVERQFSSDDELQDYFLQGVSRTFALTIPVLPVGLREAVANGYLLCRIIDTIEDDPGLNMAQKTHFSDQFTEVVEGKDESAEFAQALAPLLTDAIIPEEKELIRHTEGVIRITHSFNAAQREALSTCVRTMGKGMMHFQEHQSPAGLRDMPEMEQYCYYVAGVVGEMLTRLYCDYSPRIAKNQDELMRLSVCFGQGLQMTNILKDIWDDQKRGACWLPQEVFSRYGFDLKDLKPGLKSPGFEQGLEELIGIAHQRLCEALEYTLLIPRHETGIRNFCLWALGMAILTLKKVHQNTGFNDGREVKISRKDVKNTVLLSRLNVRSNFMLRRLFLLAGRGVPRNTNIGQPKTELES